MIHTYYFISIICYRNTTDTINAPESLPDYVIVQYSKVIDLLKNCKSCFRKSDCQVTFSGTYMTARITCSGCCETIIWHNQERINNIPYLNLAICAATYVTGTPFTKSCNIFRLLNIPCISKQTHYKHVRNIVLPSIYNFYKKEQDDLLESLKMKQVILGGDMRADSPGHCAKYGSYVTMDLETNKIIHIELLQVIISQLLVNFLICID